MWQVPPFWQGGDTKQGCEVEYWQSSPVNPGAHRQVAFPNMAWVTQVPPF